MARDRESSTQDPDRSSKKDKKDKKKSKPSEENGVTKHHKSKKDKSSTSVKTEADVPDTTMQTQDSDDEASKITVKKEKDEPVGAMVPFAEPMADEKTLRRILKNVKRSAKHKALKRGVKEVVKALRKSPVPASSAALPSSPPYIVVLAADISPIDVISHIPVLCEDHHVPYIYVPSRAELGAAGSTKRPTSVVMVMPKAGKLKGKADGGGEEDKESWEETYADMARLVEKAGGVRT